MELQPGWRLSIISPLAALGSAGINPTKASIIEDGAPPGARSLTLEAEAPAHFGYTRAVVALRRSGKGVAFRFESAERHQGESITKTSLPELLSGTFPRKGGPSRILFLTREAAVDHDVAIIQARDRTDLEALTAAVLTNPAKACRSTKESWCSWVAQGVAVRVEKPSLDGHPPAWVPVL